MNTLQVIARRVGLEVLDYKQILVDKYRCDPDVLGEVRMVNGRLDIEGIVDLSYEKLTKLPFKFGKVGGSFFCNSNELTSLEGAPREVGLSFYCNDNKLTSLEGAPLEVGGGFFCEHNKLTSLEGAPREVGGNFDCYDNNLQDDVKKPVGVKGNFFKGTGQRIVKAAQQDDLTVASALIDEACDAAKVICSVLDEQVEHIEPRFIDPIKTTTRILLDQLSSCGIYIEQYSLKRTEPIKAMTLRASEAAFKSSRELTQQINSITSIQGWHSVLRNSSVIARRDIERVLKIIKS